MSAVPVPSAASVDDARGRWLPFGVLLLAAAVRIPGLGMRSVWVDEGFTWATARAPFGKIAAICATQDASPPLYYMLTSLALRFGDSEAVLRSVSLLASLGLVWMTYRLARLFAGRGQAAAAGALMALSPFQVMYAQEARTYTLVAFFMVASTYFFLRAAVFGRSRGWIPYALVLAAGLYTQNIIVFGVLIQLVLFFCIPEARRRVVPWFTATAAAALSYLPWALYATRIPHHGDSHWYLEKPGLREIFHVIRGVAMSPIPLVTAPDLAPTPGLETLLPRGLAQLVLLALPAIPFLLGLRLASESGAKGTLARIGLVGLLLPLLAVLTVSLVKPLWLPRYFVFAGPFLFLILAAGLSILRPARLSGLWLSLLLVTGAYGILRYHTDYTKEPWRDVVRTIDFSGSAGSKVAIVAFDSEAFFFYNSKLASPMPAFEYSHPEVPFSGAYTDRQIAEMTSEAETRTRAYDEVWIIQRGPGSPVRRRVIFNARNIAASGRTLVAEWRWESTGGPIRATCWRR